MSGLNFAVFDATMRGLLPLYAAAAPDGTRDGKLLLHESHLVEFADQQGFAIAPHTLTEWLTRQAEEYPGLVRRVNVSELPIGPPEEIRQRIAKQAWWLNLRGLGIPLPVLGDEPAPEPEVPGVAARVSQADELVELATSARMDAADAVVTAINANTAAQLAIVAQLGEIARLLRNPR